jgi:hypothetical protein
MAVPTLSLGTVWAIQVTHVILRLAGLSHFFARPVVVIWVARIRGP